MWLKKVIAASVFCLFLLSGTQAQLNQATRQNLQVWIEWDTLAIGYDPSQKDDLKQGVVLGLAMWQSILPDLHWHWATNAASANCVITATSSGQYSTGGGTLTKANISLLVGRYGRSLTFGPYTGISRDAMLAAYVPATWPPIHYGSPYFGNTGYIGGRFEYNGGEPNWDVNLNEGHDVAITIFHEFGHSLGMVDNSSGRGPDYWVFSAEDFAVAYGHPYVPGQTAPAQPAITPKTLAAPKAGSNNIAMWPPSGWPAFPLPNGGTSYFGCGTTTDALTNVGGYGVIYDVYNIYAQKGVSAFNKLHPIVLIQNNNMPTKTGFNGITSPGGANFNKRVISGLDINPTLMPDLPWTFPVVSGVIALTRPDGKVALANNWYSAISKAQLDLLNQSNPYLINTIFPECNNLKLVSAGALFSAAVRADGKVFAWGDNANGEIGINSSSLTVTTPTQVSLSVPVRSVACGGEFMVMLDTAGQLWSCGFNNFGMLGNNSTVVNSKVPVAVGNISGQPCNGNKYVAIACGSSHCVALKDDGTIWAWGYNGLGQIGDGTTTNRYFPVKIGTQNDWVAVYAGAFHSFASKADGNFYAWGYNNVGQLGTGTFSSMTTPTPAGGGHWGHLLKNLSVSQNNQSIGIATDGTLWGWGLNDQSQIDGSNYNSPMPRQIGSDNDWVACNGGWDFSMAMKQDGSLFAWGRNSDGILLTFNGSTNQTTPFKVSTTQHFKSFSCGAGHAIGLTDDGYIYTWGYNNKGQLGTGNTNSLLAVTRSNFRTNCISVAGYSLPSTAINLTNEGCIDWIVFDMRSPLTRKLTGPSISNFSLLKSGTVSTFSQNLAFNWTQDGPTNNISNSSGSSKAGIQITGQNYGFSFTSSASMAARTLKLYCGVENATAKLEITGDGSSTFTPITLTNTNGITYRMYSITFNAASTGKKLTVKWTNTSTTGNVKLIAATLR